MEQASPEHSIHPAETQPKVTGPEIRNSKLGKVTRHFARQGQILLFTAAFWAACGDNGDSQNPPQGFEPVQTASQTVEARPQVSFADALSRAKLMADHAPEGNDIKDTIAHFEKVHNAASSLVEASEAEQTEGKPTLVVQQKAMYKNLDLKPLWEGKYTSEDEFLKDQIAFYHDQRVLEETLTDIFSSGDLLDPEEVSNRITAEALFKLKISEDIYTHLNQPQEITITFADNSPQNQQALEILQGIPRLTPLIVDYTDDPNLTGAIFTAYPPTITLRNGTSLDSLSHELGHANDPYENPNILRNVPPEKGINLMITRNNDVLHSRAWDNYRKIYSPHLASAPQKEADGLPLTPEEINAKVSWLANRMVSSPAGRGTGLNENIFAPSLENETLQNLIAQDGAVKYKTLEEFINGEQATLSQIASEDAELKMVIDTIRENPQIFQHYYGNTPSSGFDGRAVSVYARDLQQEFAPTILTTMFFENDEALNSIPRSERTELTGKLFEFVKYPNREQFAEVFDEAISHDGQEPAAISSYVEMIKN